MEHKTLGGLMAYYNRKGEALILGKMEYLSSGECASVCHNGEIILKEYFSDTLMDCRLTAEVFDILKDIDNEHFMKLFDIYSDMSLLELIQYRLKARKFVVDAYTAKYYQDDSVNVLYESIDYLLDNFGELEKLFTILADNSIVTDDVKRKNAILSPNGIIIIDPDIFSISSFSKQEIAIENKKDLLVLLRSICLYCLGEVENKEEIKRRIVLDLANIDIDPKTDITYEISKKLKQVKRPIDYLMK